MAEQGGRDTDGEGTQGLVEEKSRPAGAGETGTTRFGMEGDDADGAETGGKADQIGAARRSIATDRGASGEDSDGDNFEEDSQ